MAKNVTTIPATRNRFTADHISSRKKRKVAGYARVSTDMEDQQTSYAAQCDYYTSYIQSREDWEFVGLYSDEGISATSTRHREGFNKMVEDALDGKIDLIITKSVSRFARNTVDSLSTISRLKDNGTECYFEKDVVFQIKRAANLQIILAPYKIDVVLQPHYPETLLHITRTKILPCKLIAQEYSVSSYENGSSSSSIWQA